MNKYKEEETERAKFTVDNVDAGNEYKNVILVGLDISKNKWYVEMDCIHMLKMPKVLTSR